MKSIAFLTLTVSILTGTFAQAALECPASYQLVKACTNNNKVLYKGSAKVPVKNLVFCRREETPMWVLVSEKPMDKELEAELTGLDDNMFGRNGIGVFSDSKKKLAVTFAPMTNNMVRVYVSDPQAQNGPPQAASQFDCP